MMICERDIQRALRAIDPRWRLKSVDALTARASALQVSTGAKTDKRMILLTHSESDRERNPHIARDEFQLLATLTQAGLPVPDALTLRESHQPPFFITSFVEGSSDCSAEGSRDFPKMLATVLCRIHALDLAHFDLSFLPKLEDRTEPVQSPLAPELRKLHTAMRRALPRVEFNAPALLHGDFWPGNLLWSGGELAAIIDWEDAMLGDPLADLGKSRLEILWALGPETMEVYTAAYLALNPKLNATALPFWDLWGASRLSHYPSFAPAPDAVPRLRAQYEAFIAAAIGRLEAL